MLYRKQVHSVSPSAMQARWSALLLVLALAGSPVAQRDNGRPNDEAYTRKIREYTTEPFFLTELVDHLPASDNVPTPESVLGYVIGTPNVLTYSADCNRYMRALADASPRVTVLPMGKSEEGREMILVVITDQENLARIERYKEINALLSDPRKINEEQAEELIAEGLPMYWATGAMHSPETGSPEMLMELAYRLAVEESPIIQAIRKSSIVMITPVLETDGRDRYVDTYLWRKKNPDKPAIPLVYWGHYVAHDNNRDGMAVSLAMSKNLMRTWFDFHPQVLHDLHESVPYLYVSTGTGPYNAWLDPIVVDEWHILAYNEVNEMTRRGVPGVWTHGFYDGWAPNYAFYAANGHNAIGRFYETFGGGGADTGIRTAGNNTREWYRPNPPFPRVRWSIRNNINLQQSALLLGLHFVATNKERFLRNYYLKSKRSVAKARAEGPAAYVFPANEQRKGQQAALLNQLRRQGVEIHRLDADIETKDGKYAKGSYVVRMDQPYSRMADMLLDKQYYNPSDPRPYDDTGWTLGPLFNVEANRCKDSAVLAAKMTLVAADVVPAGGVSGDAKTAAVLVRNHADFQIAQLRYRLPSAAISVAEKTFKAGGDEYPAGTLIIGSGGRDHSFAETKSALEKVGLKGVPLSKPPDVATHALEAPRIAILHTWTSTQDEGWYRIAFDQLGIPYSYVSVHEIRDNPNLREEYDVIIFAPSRGGAQSLVNGINKDGEPIPWKPMEGFAHLGGPDTSDNIRGGIELAGMLHLQQFLNGGGLLITVANTCAVPVDYGLVSGVTIAQPDKLQAFGCVLLAENVAKESPALYGYGDTLGVYFSSNRGPLFSLGGAAPAGGGQAPRGRSTGRGSATDPDVAQGRPPYTPEKRDGDVDENPAQTQTGPRPKVLLRFAAEDKLLISGLLADGGELAGRPAVIDCAVGKGHVLMFAINPMWRQQTHGSFALLFNAAMSYKNL